MKTIATLPLLLGGIALTLAACGQQAEPAPEPERTEAVPSQRAAPTPPPAPPLVPPGEEADATPLTPAGFGPYVVGESLAAERQGELREVTPRASENCRLYRDPGLPGVEIMTDGEVVTRVSVRSPSTIITGAGVHVGASEADIRAVYPELRRGSGAGDLYTAGRGDDGLRFEIGRDGNVAAMHGGGEPALSQSEGCA